MAWANANPMQANNWLQGRHALITGGGTGIGAAAAEQLHGAGAKLSLLGRRLEPLNAVANPLGGTAIQCDVTDRRPHRAPPSMKPALQMARSTC